MLYRSRVGVGVGVGVGVCVGVGVSVAVAVTVAVAVGVEWSMSCVLDRVVSLNVERVSAKWNGVEAGVNLDVCYYSWVMSSMVEEEAYGIQYKKKKRINGV